MPPKTYYATSIMNKSRQVNLVEKNLKNESNIISSVDQSKLMSKGFSFSIWIDLSGSLRIF